MNNYIFLTNQYLPKPGATGLCVHQLAKQLASKGENVYTVCYEDGDKEEQYDGVKIIKINIPLSCKEYKKSSKIIKKLQRVLSLCSKLIHFRQYPLKSFRLIHRYKKAISNILEEKGKVTIIASYTPLEAVVAAASIKRKHPNTVKVLYYSTDTLSNEQGNGGFLSAEYRMNLGVKWEKRLFEIYDKILIMECHKEHYLNLLPEFKNKYQIVSFPLFKKIESSHNIKKDDRVSLVYAGTLYQKLRNPQFLINMLMELKNIINYKAYFLGGGDCDLILKNAEKDSSNVISYLGMQSHKKALEYINNADILLSIGNEESPMAPSKIYEYMSTGKPIIHVYTYKKDPCLIPLQKYGNALLINANSDVDILKVKKFINERKCLDYDGVKNKFIQSTPEYTIGIIEKIWEE